MNRLLFKILFLWGLAAGLGAQYLESRLAWNTVGGVSSAHLTVVGTQFGIGIYGGGEAVHSSVFLDPVLFSRYGFDYTGLIGGAAYGALKLLEKLALVEKVYADPFTALSVSILNPRFEAALTPHLRFSLGNHSSFYVWQDMALVFQPYLGLVALTNPYRGVFQKYPSADRPSGWSAELRLYGRFVPWASRAKHGIPEGFGLGVALFKDW